MYDLLAWPTTWSCEELGMTFGRSLDRSHAPEILESWLHHHGFEYQHDLTADQKVARDALSPWTVRVNYGPLDALGRPLTPISDEALANAPRFTLRVVCPDCGLSRWSAGTNVCVCEGS